MKLTEISNAAYVLWRKAELARAEQVLSCDIGCSSSLLHYHLANRALVRARLGRWNLAFDDAQSVTRISIPTLAARANSKCY